MTRDQIADLTDREVDVAVARYVMGADDVALVAVPATPPHSWWWHDPPAHAQPREYMHVDACPNHIVLHYTSEIGWAYRAVVAARRQGHAVGGLHWCRTPRDVCVRALLAVAGVVSVAW